MHDTKTFWLTVTNIVLGLALMLLLLGLATGILCDYISVIRKRRALYREIDDFLNPRPRRHGSQRLL